MDIIILILIVFSALLVAIVTIIIIKRRKKWCKSKKEEGGTQEEQHRKEEERICLEKECKQLEEECELVNDRKRREQKERKKLEEKQYLKEEEEKVERGEKAKKSEGEKKRKEDARKERKELPPYKRGGRPRDPTRRDKTEQTQGERTHVPKPEIICWNKGWEWIVGIEVPEEFASPNVTQNGESIVPDNSDETHYPLSYLRSVVKVEWKEGEQDKEIEIPIIEDGRNYLIFKMRKGWKGLGRAVRQPTNGYYLAIVPYEWKRNEEISGPTLVASENVQINGYNAHFFYLRQNKDTSIAFINTNGKRIQVKSSGSSFQLIGKEIYDSSDDMGPLFGEEPPRIKTFDEQGWDNVSVIVIGKEGSGRNRWRIQFSPKEGMIEQKMPDDLANRQGGWYFVRIYDNNDNLLESMDFRFSAGLKSIQIMNSVCLPEKGRYSNVEVRFNHQANCKIEPSNEGDQTFEISRENNLTIIKIPPKPYCDRTYWVTVEGDSKTKVTILVERIWWSLGDFNRIPENWTDKIIDLYCKDFSATSNKVLWVKLPRPRFVRKINVGFGYSKSRSYQVEVNKEVFSISLCDFCDAEEIENKQEEFAMKIWVSPEEKQTYESIVLKLLPGLPKVKPKTQQIITHTTLPKPEAEVKSLYGKRKGRGFSKREIIGAGLTMEFAKHLHVPYDKRRKSSHPWNIKRLRSINNR